MNSADPFETRADAYEAMIDWPRRLANEKPLYQWLIDRFTVRRVLDCACGAGYHAAMLEQLGLEVEGETGMEVEAADISPAMLQRARQRIGAESRIHLVQRGFDQPVPTPGAFDLAICVGNSLPLVSDRQTVKASIANLLQAVRPGGAILVQVLNLWRLPEGLTQWSKCKLADLPSPAGRARSLIIKGVHRAQDMGFVDLLITTLSDPTPSLQSECVQFLGLKDDELATYARAAGAGQIEFFGDYARNPYDPASSVDLIMLAQRQ